MDKKPGHTKVKVVVRVRPALAADVEACVKVTENKVCILNHRNKGESLEYEFSSVYDERTTQNHIFDDCVQPLLDSTLQGQNVSIFAYGPTGAGKTHTMLGTVADPGIIPRVVKSLFSSIEIDGQDSREHPPQHTVTFSYMEIYNEKVQDLLSGKQDLPIREDYNHNIFVAGLTEKGITSFEAFNSHFGPASSNRTVAATKLNQNSSRSHSILMLKVHRKVKAKLFTGKIYLIDLAGSEDNRRTGNKGIRLKESGAINKSLFVLGEVVDAINHNLSRVPYRNSKLTRLLQDSIGGSCQCVMITNIAPEPHYYYDTYCTLNFATKSKRVVNVNTVHVQEDSQPSPAKPTATVKPIKRRNSLIPVPDGTRPKTSLSSSTAETSSSALTDLMILPSPLRRHQKELETAFENLKAMNEKIEELKRLALSGGNTGMMTSSSSSLVNVQPYLSSQLLLRPGPLRRSSLGSRDSPDVIFSTPNITTGKLVDSTNSWRHHPLKGEQEGTRLRLKRRRLEEPDCSHVVHDHLGGDTKVKRRRNSDLTPVRQKVQGSFNNKPEQIQRNSNFLDLVNSASMKELQQLQTVGIKRAKAIFDWRQIHGDFDFIDSLKQIPGFTDKYIQNLLRSNLVTA